MSVIYVNYFSPEKLIENEVLRPIQVGSKLSPNDLGILRDDTGENISDKNNAYCELTGVYWAWKNDLESDYLGFVHYRRFFDFRPDRPRKINKYGMIDCPRADSLFIEKYGFDESTINNVLESCDAVLPALFDVREVGQPSVRDHYRTAPYHHIEDLENAGQAIAELAPEYAPMFEQVMDGHVLYPNNMFVFRRELFEKYCGWLFPILERLEETIDVSGYNRQEARAIGYVAERLFTVFSMHEMKKNPQLKVTTLHRILIQDTSPAPSEPPLPKTDLPLITVVASSDQAYLPHLGALIVSVFENTNPDRYVDFIVLDGGLTEAERRLVRKLANAREYASVSFIDMRSQHLNIPVHSYFARATYFRLSLPKILEHRERVIFLDTDMVVVGDLAELADTDLGEASIAGVPDLIMRAFCEMKVPSLAACGGNEARIYLRDYLGMGERTRDYFQAGTLIMELGKLRSRNMVEKLCNDVAETTYWFLDQDAMNKNLLGHVKHLDNKWNVVHMDGRHVSALTAGDQLLYRNSLNAPAVVHYAGLGKPWINSKNPFSHYYWEYLRSTSWYETMLFSFLDRRYAEPAPRKSLLSRATGWVRRQAWRQARNVWHMLPAKVKIKMWPLADRLSRRMLS